MATNRGSPNGEVVRGAKVGVSLFVFGLRYIDDIILRVRDDNDSGLPGYPYHIDPRLEPYQ